MFEALPSPGSDLGAHSTKSHKSKNEWTDRELREGLFETLGRFSKNVCLFIDGLDEYQGDMHELIALFRELPYRICPGKVLKVCLASRPESVISLSLGVCPGLRMQDHNLDGIKSYVSATITRLRTSQPDEVRLQNLSASIAYKAEGVVLWARFAVSEIIQAYAGGETEVEVDRRLRALPGELEGLYANIFKRMRPEDRNEARLMFQLVCFAEGPYTSGQLPVEQLREAVATAKDCRISPTPENRTEAVERFRKRFIAKSGGLLEDVSYDSKPIQRGGRKGVYMSKPWDVDPFLRRWIGSNIVKTIHRTAESYVHRKGWLMGWKTGQVEHTSPHALWLYICCKSIQSVPKPLELEPSFEDWDDSCSSMQGRLDSTLYEYACEHVFSHARRMEYEHAESSFHCLSLVSISIWRDLRRRLRWNLRLRHGRVGSMIRNPGFELDRDVIYEVSHPWQIMVEQGLGMCVRDALQKRVYRLLPDGHDISLSIDCLWGYSQASSKFYSLEFRPCQELIGTLIEFGALVNQTHIIECLHVGNASILEMLFDAWPAGRLDLSREASYNAGSWYKPYLEDEDYDEGNDTFTGEPAGPLWNEDPDDDDPDHEDPDDDNPDDDDPNADVPRGDFPEQEYYDERNDSYAGESVGPLWELARGDSLDGNFESMLDLLLARGEPLNQICGPGGTMLHALIIKSATFSNYNMQILDYLSVDVKRIRALIERGADVNAQGPRGKPLELVWRTLQFCWLEPEERLYLQGAMIALRAAGADASLVDSDGAPISKEEIDELCAIFKSSSTVFDKFARRVFAKPGWYTYDVPVASHHRVHDLQPPALSEVLKEYR